MDSLNFKQPLFFEKNRVSRVYTGGALFADFFGDDSVDCFEPEEWIVSSVKAINKTMKSEKEGISKVKDTSWYFDDLLKTYPKELLGERKQFGVLTKYLDSAIRLPAQAHPDKAFSHKYFNSEYGKAESWLVLATRPDACIYFGFKRKVSKEEFSDAVELSKNDPDIMEKFLNRIPVKPGDVFFVPAKMIHAIGKGCLILEIQEPTDFTIQPEYLCGDYLLNEQEMYIGLDKQTALDVFDYDTFGEDAISEGRRTPIKLWETNGVTAHALITYNDTPCFAVNRYTFKNGQMLLPFAPAVYVITNGSGTLKYGNETIPIKKSDYFFLPYAAADSVTAYGENLQIVACLPPKK